MSMTEEQHRGILFVVFVIAVLLLAFCTAGCQVTTVVVGDEDDHTSDLVNSVTPPTSLSEATIGRSRERPDTK